MAQRREQRRIIRRCQLAGTIRFEASGAELGTVDIFKYLGRMLSSLDSDWPAVHRNLSRARQRWGSVSRVLAREGANPRISGMFYKAVVQTVLLYGCESWVLSKTMDDVLVRFHHRIARRLSGCTARKRGDQWEYPPIAEALETAGLFPMGEYISRRVDRVRAHVSTRPVAVLCDQSRVLPGTAARQVWWEPRREE